MTPRIRLALLALLLGLLAWFGQFVAGGVTAATASPGRFHSSMQCGACHPAVWREWFGSQHQVAYLNPEVRRLSDDFRNRDCQACHLPRPVAVTGYGQRTLHRDTRPEEGVGCLTCHVAKDGGILGRAGDSSAPCRVRGSRDLVSVDLCASCHNQHGTTDQWRATPLPAQGTDCNACHMPAVARAGGRRGRSHEFAGAHDVDTLRKALRFAAQVADGRLVLEVENEGAGHNVPTEERSRAVDVDVSFDGAAGRRVHRFRLPYRSEDLPDTTLPRGATRTLEVAIPAGAARARARVWYRLAPYIDDDHPRSVLLFEQDLDLRGGPGPVRRPPLPARSAFRPRPDPEVIPTPPPAPAVATAAALPGVPPLELAPLLPRLSALVAAGPARPDAARMRELRDLLGAALEPGVARGAVAARLRRSLLAQADVSWALEEALTHEDLAVRASAAFELGQLGRAESVVPLVLRLKYEVDRPAVFVWIVDALARLGNCAGLPDLAALFDVEATAQLAGARALDICGRAGIALGDAPTWDDLRRHLRALHESWQEQRPAIDPDASTLARIARHLLELQAFQLRGVDEARFVLQRLGAAPLPLLREALHASEPYLRTHVLEILCELGPQARAATPDVLPLLRDSLTRADAARVLGRLGARDAVPALAACLDAADVELRAAAAGALGPLGDAAIADRLQRLGADAGQPLDVRVQAAFSLALLRRDEPEPVRFLEDLRRRGAYHAATLDALLDRVGGRR